MLSNKIEPISLQEVARLLNIKPVSIHAARQRERARLRRIAWGWHCIQCGKPITDGPAHKVFCKPGCCSNYHRDEKRREANLERMLPEILAMLRS